MPHSVFVRAAALVLGIATAASAQSLRGSKESVDLMYGVAQQRGLQFLRTPQDVYEAARVGALKLVSMTEDLDVDKAGWPFVLPNTLRFADSLSVPYHAACGERLVVTSGARPLSEQPHNASPKSVHPTGMAVDFRKPKTPACLSWLRTSLMSLEATGAIEATEEKHPAHFHVAVLRQAPVPRIQMAAGDVAPSMMKPVSHRRSRARSTASLASKKGAKRR